MRPSEDPRVALCSAECATYDESADERVWKALSRAGIDLGWSDHNRGPLAQIIPVGARVLLKPNLVNHENHAPFGGAPLLTHRSVINAAFRAAILAGASEIVVGDAPIQSCDFNALLKVAGLDTWSEAAAIAFPGFAGVRDFRRTVSVTKGGVRHASENVISQENFVLFDLGHQSMLEPVTNASGSFRVTCYDPQAMYRTHAPGRHQYLVTRAVLDADVVVNLPKLKTHKKAGITCALKNLVGINGNKEFLPHHRVGGSSQNGDCYPGANGLKAMLEHVLDRQNSAQTLTQGRIWRSVAYVLQAALKLGGDSLGVEGSWSGNDTVWRMCLDLNRILIYGQADGTLSQKPQRKVVHFVDAIVAGQGNGPLSPEPFPLGMLLLGQSAAAVDLVGAQLLGYDPEKIPLVRHAFEVSPWPITRFSSFDVELAGDFGGGSVNDVLASIGAPLPTSYPAGWVDAVRGPSDQKRVALKTA